MKDLSLGFSPCPNDTFMFYALVRGKVGRGRLRFREVIEDVETLNQMALRRRLDITKASFHVLGHLRDDYSLLRSGCALGRGCGPLVVSLDEIDLEHLRGRSIAVPGLNTTAFLLLQMADPSLRENVKVMPFDRIIEAVKHGETDAGLIIHESRFTYEAAGLKKVIDLGDWWEMETGLPIPLGGILAKRSLGSETVEAVEASLRESIAYAYANRSEPLPYIRRHAQEIDDDVTRRHIDLYVNNYSLDLGSDGARAVSEFFRLAEDRGVIPGSSRPLFMRDNG